MARSPRQLGFVAKIRTNNIIKHMKHISLAIIVCLGLGLVSASAQSNIDSENIGRSIKDEESGKYGGPNTETVVAVLEPLVVLPGMTGGPVSYDLKVRRGETLQSLGMGDVPAGTKIFPIQFKGVFDGRETQLTYHFYKDSFGDWKSVAISD